MEAPLTTQPASRSLSLTIAAWMGLVGSMAVVLGCCLPAEVITPIGGGRVPGVKGVAFKSGSYNLYQLLDPAPGHVLVNRLGWVLTALAVAVAAVSVLVL